MYQSYMKRTQDGLAPITTKSRQDDEAEVLLYIAFAYFDWARQTELFNNAQAAPADERYRKCTEHLELALRKSKRKEVLLQYNLCMTKLQAANCVLQKLTRNIRRTAKEVQDALEGLEKSLPKVQEILKWKTEGKKIHIPTSMLQDFITHCKANIESAKSHLDEERRREEEAAEIRELQRVAAESQKREEEILVVMKREEEAKKQEERDRKAAQKMMKVEQLRQGWEYESQMEKAAAEKRSRVKQTPEVVVEEEEDPKGLFDDDDDDAPNNDDAANDTSKLFDSDDDEPASKPDSANQPVSGATEKDLFGSSDEGSEDELLESAKRVVPEDDDLVAENPPAKKVRLLDDDDDDD